MSAASAVLPAAARSPRARPAEKSATPPGRLERLTESAVFIALLLLSLAGSVILLLGGALYVVLAAGDAGPFAVAIGMVVAGGITGMVGLARAHSRRARSAAGVEVTIVCLTIGCVPAALVAGAGVALLFVGGLAVPFALALAASHAIHLVAALGFGKGLTRRYAAATGQRFDSLPVLLLLLALALAAAAVLLSLLT